MLNLIQCESCKGLISGAAVNIHDKQIKPGIQARVWDCNNCGHEHFIMVMDKTSRRMMQENKKDREKIGNINKRAQILKGQNQLTEEQAVKDLSQVEMIQARIDKRTKELDERSQRLANEYQEAMR